MKTFEEFNFKDITKKEFWTGKKEPIIEPEDKSYEELFVRQTDYAGITYDLFNFREWAKLARLSAMYDFIKVDHWYKINLNPEDSFYHGFKYKIVKVSSKNYDDKIDDIFKISYFYEYSNNAIRRISLDTPEVIKIDVWKEDDVTIEPLELIEDRKNRVKFQQLNIKTGDNIRVVRAYPVRGFMEPETNILKVTGIDKGFYWAKVKGEKFGVYKIMPRDVIEKTERDIINRDVDPYGEEDWEQ